MFINLKNVLLVKTERTNNINTTNIQQGHRVLLCYIQCKSLSQSSSYAPLTSKFSSACRQVDSFLSLLLRLSSLEHGAGCLHSRPHSSVLKSFLNLITNEDPCRKIRHWIRQREAIDYTKANGQSIGQRALPRPNTNQAGPPKRWSVTIHHRGSCTESCESESTRLGATSLCFCEIFQHEKKEGKRLQKLLHLVTVKEKCNMVLKKETSARQFHHFVFCISTGARLTNCTFKIIPTSNRSSLFFSSFKTFLSFLLCRLFNILYRFISAENVSPWTNFPWLRSPEGGESKVMKLPCVPKGLALVDRVDDREELLWRGRRAPETEITRDTNTTQPGRQLRLLTQKPLRSLTAELTSSSRLMTYSQFFSSVPHWTKDIPLC